MDSGKIKVLYIAGMGRSGSTILGNILGQIEGFFHVGEVREIWEHGVIENQPCGCGVPFEKCLVWSAVFARAFQSMDQVTAQMICRVRNRGIRTRHLPLMFIPGAKSFLNSRLEQYPATLEKLYRAIQDVTGTRVIVDSSKVPSYAHILGMLPAIDLYIVHLIRDPRAVAYSWQRKKFRPDAGRHMQQLTPAATSLRWNLWNMTIAMLQSDSPERKLRLRYEDFIDNPQKAIIRILGLVRERTTQLPFLTENRVEIGSTHTIWGNPNRLHTGNMELRPDDEWKVKMKQADKIIAMALTLPLLLKYGYKALV